MIDYQAGFNIAITLAAFLGGWVLNSIRDSVRSLHTSDVELSAKVQSIEVLVAGQYVTHTTLDKRCAELYTVLARIESKIDGKADK